MKISRGAGTGRISQANSRLGRPEVDDAELNGLATCWREPDALRCVHVSTMSAPVWRARR